MSLLPYHVTRIASPHSQTLSHACVKVYELTIRLSGPMMALAGVRPPRFKKEKRKQKVKIH